MFQVEKLLWTDTLLLYRAVLVLIQMKSLDYVGLHLASTFTYLAPTIAALFNLYYFYGVLVPPDVNLVIHSFLFSFITFCFKQYFVGKICHP